MVKCKYTIKLKTVHIYQREGTGEVKKKGKKKSPTKAGLYEGFGNDILSQVLPKYHLLGGA